MIHSVSQSHRNAGAPKHLIPSTLPGFGFMQVQIVSLQLFKCPHNTYTVFLQSLIVFGFQEAVRQPNLQAAPPSQWLGPAQSILKKYAWIDLEIQNEAKVANKIHVPCSACYLYSSMSLPVAEKRAYRNDHCCVPQCNNNARYQPHLSFHWFPKGKKK